MSSDKYYDDLASGYNELHGQEQLQKYRIIASYLQLPETASVLDVGAGTGIGHSVIPNTGIDPAAELIKQHPNKSSTVGKAEHLPYPDNSFDAVLCVTAIHHTDYRQAVKEMQRVTRGPIAITLLKRSATTQHILEYLREHLKPLAVIEEERDYICIYPRKD